MQGVAVRWKSLILRSRLLPSRSFCTWTRFGLIGFLSMRGAHDLGSGSSSSDVEAEARLASLALVGPGNWVVGMARPAREHLKILEEKSLQIVRCLWFGFLSPVGSGQGGGDLGSALGARRGARVIPGESRLLQVFKEASHLSRSVSMAPGVWGLPLTASVAPRALTSLGTRGGRGRARGELEIELQRRIVQMLENIYKMYF